MVDGIKAAFAKRVDTIDWMAPETKKEAIKKVETIVVGVGYPESWRDYGRYTVAADSAYANEIAGGKVEYAHRSEEHTSELQSLMRISYAVFCLKKKKYNAHYNYNLSKKPTSATHPNNIATDNLITH